MVDGDKEATSGQSHHDWVLPQSPGPQASLGVYAQGLCPLLRPDSKEAKAHVESPSQHLKRLDQASQWLSQLRLPPQTGTQEVKYLPVFYA